MLEQINIEDAPLLERLFTDGVSYGQQIQVIRAPKLKILGYLSDCVSASEFGIRILKVANQQFSSMHLFAAAAQ